MSNLSYNLHADSDLSSGNAQILEIRTHTEIPEIHFAARPLGGPETIWFNFRITPNGEIAPGSRARCVLHFYELLLGNLLECKTDNFHPVYRTDKTGWTRVTSVRRDEQPDGQIRASWEVPVDQGPVQVALSFPYGRKELTKLINESGSFYRTDKIGLSENGRLLERISNRPGSPGSTAPGIYCLARQHAAETPGSWVLDGFLRHLAGLGPDAPLVWAVPFADIDGVEAGRPGKDAYPWDFNRSWGSKLFPKEAQAEYGTHPMRHEVKCLQQDMLRWKNRCRPRLVLDFHAPVVRKATGIFCYLRDLDETGAPDARHAPWARALESAIETEMRQDPFICSGRYPSRWNTARVGDFVNQALDLPMVTLEVPYGNSPRLVFTQQDYQRAGQQMARAILSQI